MGFINAFKGAYKGFLNNRHETEVLPRKKEVVIRLLVMTD